MCQTEPIQLLCFPSAPPVYASRKSGGVVMPISMRGGGVEWDTKGGGVQSSGGEMLQVVA